MNNEYQEIITCVKCKNEYTRDIEYFNISGKHCDLDHPLNVIIVKKFKCNKCKVTGNYSVNIIKKQLTKEVI